MKKHTTRAHKKTNPTTLTTKEFLRFYTNEKTRANYQIAIKHFLLIATGENVKDKDLNTAGKKYLQQITEENSNYYLHLINYGRILKESYSPTTANLYLRCARIWIEECGFTLTKHEKQRLATLLPPAKPVNKEIELKRKTIRILYYTLPKETATLLIVLLASGMRIGEALALKKTNIDWGEKRTEIKIPARYTKTKSARTTYLTREASQILLDYLRSRSDTDPRIFPFSVGTAQYHLRKATLTLGIASANRKNPTFHWHMTRKWFISRFSLAANKDVAEHLAGHEGYLTENYRRYTKKQIIKEYIKAEKKLSILNDEK